MKKPVLYLSFFAVVLLNIAAIQYSAQPPEGFTGGNGEDNCQICHTDGKLNPTTGSLNVNFNSGKNTYIAGTKYPVSVILTESGTGVKKWGFELTMMKNGVTVGTFDISTDNTLDLSLITDNKQYVRHKSAATTTNSHTWTFYWTAPVGMSGDITISVAGNAADGNGLPTKTNTSDKGDDIFTKSVVIKSIIAGLDDNNIEITEQPYLYSSQNKVYAANVSNKIEPILVSLIDAKGTLVKTIQTNSFELKNGIEVNDLNPGVYLTKFSDNNLMVKGKLVLQ